MIVLLIILTIVICLCFFSKKTEYVNTDKCYKCSYNEFCETNNIMLCEETRKEE